MKNISILILCSLILIGGVIYAEGPLGNTMSPDAIRGANLTTIKDRIVSLEMNFQNQRFALHEQMDLARAQILDLENQLSGLRSAYQEEASHLRMTLAERARNSAVWDYVQGFSSASTRFEAAFRQLRARFYAARVAGDQAQVHAIKQEFNSFMGEWGTKLRNALNEAVTQ